MSSWSIVLACETQSATEAPNKGAIFLRTQLESLGNESASVMLADNIYAWFKLCDKARPRDAIDLPGASLIR